ncbi:MAG: MFS transporter [bacterium]
MEPEGSPLRVLKNVNFLALWIGQVISQFGDRLAQMALVGLYLKQTAGISLSHSVPVMRNLFFFSTLPMLLFSPLAGVYVDRWSRKNTLIMSDLLRAGLILFIPLLADFTDGMWYIYGVIFLVFAVTCFFSPAKSAIIPNLVKQRELLAANSLSNITRMIAMIGGVTAGGIIVAWAGTKMSFYLDSLSYLLSGLAILAIRIKEDPPQKESKGGIRRVAEELMAGLNFIRKKKKVKFVATSLFILMGASGIGYLLITVFVTKALDLGTIGLSVLATFLGIGMLAGSLIYGHFGERIEREKVMVGGILVSGVCAILLGGSKSLFSMSWAVGVIGFIASPIMIAAYTLTQEITPDRIRGRVFSALEVIINSSFLLFIWVAGVLGVWLPIHRIFYLVGVGLLVYGGKTLVLRPIRE